MNENDVILEDRKILKDLFENDALSIPDYQRIYCWEEKHVHKLWNDILELKDGKTYHLGIIILHKSKNNKWNIVDGQQRLITLTLILQELGQKTLPLLQATLYTQKARNYVAYNKWLIQNYVSQLTSEDKRLLVEKIYNKLTFSVLKLNENTSLDLAYTFFSNQNSKGVPLSDYNLLKAHHLRFIKQEEQAKHLADRWDKLSSSNNEKLLVVTLGIYLFRLRKWMRKRVWDENAKYRVRDEFKSALTIPELPPFGEKFFFYEKIQGGSHFFAYAEHFVDQFKYFASTPEWKALENNLNGETHWRYKNIIATLLFGYYLKFGESYLTEALFCIERIISRHRYENKRALLYKMLEYAGTTEIVMMIDQATSPTFFLAETLDKIKRRPKVGELSAIQKRYQKCIKSLYKELSEKDIIEPIKLLIDNGEK